jgi:mRNA interferase MazF
MTSKPPFSVGDVVMIVFPYTDLSSSKLRPAVLMTHPDRDGDFIAAALTSQAGHDSSLPLSNADMAAGSLKKDSYIRADKLFTFHTSIVRRNIGQVKPGIVRNTLGVLCPLLNCC